jgi:hypothetical protein
MIEFRLMQFETVMKYRFFREIVQYLYLWSILHTTVCSSAPAVFVSLENLHMYSMLNVAF